MPILNMDNRGRFDNVLLDNEFKYDVADMEAKHKEHLSNLNVEQRQAYDEIVKSVDNKEGRMFFVDGYSDTGKTYL